MASPWTAGALGGFAFLAVAGVVPLAVLAHQTSFFNVTVIPLIGIVFVVVGTVVARSQVQNPVGWVLLNPLRRRVQHLVDRRFNRARYDAEAIVAAFTLRLRDAVDLDTVRSELVTAVEGAIQPSHASVWIRLPAGRIGEWNSPSARPRLRP